MKNIYKFLTVIIVIIIVTIASVTIFQNIKKADTGKPVVKIGVILPLTGDLAFIGKSLKSGAELAVDELKETKYRYELIFEDDQINPTKSVSALNKLVSFDNISGVISFSGTVGQALAPVAEKLKVPHFAISSDLGAAVGDYNYINFVSPVDEAKTFVSALKDKNIKKIATFSQSGNSGIKMAFDNVEEGLKENSIKNTTEYFNAGDKDFRTIIQKLQDTSPDIYFLLARSPEIELIAKQLREVGITTPITSIEGFGLSTQLSLYEGQWFVDPAEPSTDFMKKMQDKYGNVPSVYAANVYDSIKLFVKAVEGTGDGSAIPSNSDMNKNLSKIIKEKYDGAVGKGLYFDNNGVLVDKAGIKEIRNGEIVYIGRK